MRVLLGISISIIFHILLAIGLSLMPPAEFKNEIVDLVLIEATSQNQTNQQIVSAVQLPANLAELSEQEQSQFLSQFRQRVQQQTRAALTGPSKNRSSAQKNPPTAAVELQKPHRLQLDPRKPGNLDIFQSSEQPPGSRPPTAPTMARDPIAAELEKGLSTIGDALPTDIEVGSFTALNTDQSLFYTFYARINEMIRFRWESAVRTAINQTPVDRWTYNPLGIWTTQLDVVLDRNGVIREILLMKPSGFRGFDQAAAFAFRDSKAFYNPPKEMIDPEDGTIRLKYSFQVRYEPKVVVKSRQ